MKIVSVAGKSRSVTIVTAYIMTVTGLTWHDALIVIKVARNKIGPSDNFLK